MICLFKRIRKSWSFRNKIYLFIYLFLIPFSETIVFLMLRTRFQKGFNNPKYSDAILQITASKDVVHLGSEEKENAVVKNDQGNPSESIESKIEEVPLFSICQLRDSYRES